MDAKNLKPFWLACESLCTAGVMEEWRREITDAEVMSAAMQLLAPVQRSADYYPCTIPLGCGGTHAVVRHDDGSIVAVCVDEDSDCDAIDLKEDDLTFYQLDFQKLFKGLAKAGGFDAIPTPDVDIERPVHFGNLEVNGIVVPAYFEFRGRTDESVVAMIEVMAGSNPVIFVQISPMKMWGLDRLSRFAQSRMVVAIHELLYIREDGGIGIGEGFRERMDEFRERAQRNFQVARVQKALSEESFRTADDYHTVTIHRRTFPHLTNLQADVVRVLHKALLSGVPEMSYAAISTEIEEMHLHDPSFETPDKMGKVFRAPDERCQIITTTSRGHYRLNI